MIVLLITITGKMCLQWQCLDVSSQ